MISSHMAMSIYIAARLSVKWFQCSKTLLTGDPSSRIVGDSPGQRTAAPLGGSKRLTHWTNETVELPPSKGSGSYGILAAYCHNL
jgi:hypothetical protein